MSKLDHDAFMAAWRNSRSKDGNKIAQAEYDLVMAAVNGTWKPPGVAGMLPTEPKWLAVARSLIGTKEIPGPKHNPVILSFWRFASWLKSDEDPWCSGFVMHCMDKAGLPFPKLYPRAKSWLDWGKASQPVLGAVVVFGRAGGGHVGFLVGESGGYWYVLGGNQSNAVNITPIAKSRALGYRWPASLPAGALPLPQMSGGTVSRNEA